MMVKLNQKIFLGGKYEKKKVFPRKIILIIGTTFISFNSSMKQQPTNNEMAQQTKMMSMFMIFIVVIRKN